MTDIPAERIRPGIAVQRVNLFDREGRYVRQVTYRGTERQARAWAELTITHETDPRWHELVAILRGQA